LAQIALCSTLVWASSDESSTLRIEIENQSTLSAPDLGQSAFGFEHSAYLSNAQNYYRPGAKDSRDSLILNLNEKRRWHGLDGVLQVRNEYSQSENWNYLDAYQLYGEARVGSNTKLSLGRKLYRWSEWEKTWRQGLFQPRYLENRLNSEEAGLTGAFVDLKVGPTNFTLGVLPLFLPDFGAHMSVQGHEFASANPWFHPPASEFEFRQGRGEIHYSLKSPSSESVLNHPGLAAKLEFHQGPYFTRLSYAYKPMPQILLDFPSRNRVQIQAGSDFMDIEIQTRLLYHRVVNWDNVAQLGAWRIGASVTSETPDHDFGPDDYTAQQVGPAWIYSASVSRALETEGPHAARLTLGALKVSGGDLPDRGDFANQITLFERRYQYLEAYLIEVAKPWRKISWLPGELDTSVRALYDRLQNGGVFSVASSLQLDRDWRASVRLDMLGLLAGPAEVNDGFLSTYRSNDSLSLGLSYVF
jgi:hypothetical protein